MVCSVRCSALCGLMLLDVTFVPGAHSSVRCVALLCCVLLCAAGPISEAASDQRRPPTALTLSHCPQNISAGKSRGKPKFSTEKMNAGHAVTRESSMSRIFLKICNLSISAKNK